MKLSEKLLKLAEILGGEKNELLVAAENDELCLTIVATALVSAAEAVRIAAEEIALVEPASDITEEKLDEMAAVASAFDDSGDELLVRQASVLDELLLTIGAPKGINYKYSQVEETKIDELKKKYQGPKKEHDEMNKVSDALEKIKSAPIMKEYRVLQTSLSTRTCLKHPGQMLERIGENEYRCQLDGQIFNWEVGYELNNRHVPGSSVANQTPASHDVGHVIFQSRNDKLGN
jgi:hypothetical protein